MRSGSFEQHLKHDEELLKTAAERVLFREGILLAWIALVLGIAVAVVFLKP